MQALLARRQVMAPVRFRKDIMELSEEEFEVLLRAERVSNKMVQRELEVFRALKLQSDSRTSVKARKERRRNREVGEDLDPYARAEQRRIGRLAGGGLKGDVDGA
jgi:hypothetical protein